LVTLGDPFPCPITIEENHVSRNKAKVPGFKAKAKA